MQPHRLFTHPKPQTQTHRRLYSTHHSLGEARPVGFQPGLGRFSRSRTVSVFGCDRRHHHHHNTTTTIIIDTVTAIIIVSVAENHRKSRPEAIVFGRSGADARSFPETLLVCVC